MTIFRYNSDKKSRRDLKFKCEVSEKLIFLEIKNNTSDVLTSFSVCKIVNYFVVFSLIFSVIIN